MKTPSDRVKAWLAEGKEVQAILAKEGPRVLKKILRHQSLRETARFCHLSPTYLSLVMNGKQVISPRAFISVAVLAEYLK